MTRSPVMVRALDRGATLPDVEFPDQYLHQEPRTAAELADGAAWFVHGGPGRTGDSALYAHLRAVTRPERGLLLAGMLAWLRNPIVRWSLRRMGLATPLVDDSVLAVCEIAFGSVVRPDRAAPGMPDLYEAIAPVYEFFHQFNTGLVPDLRPGDFHAFGPLPVGVIRTDLVRPGAPLIPNDSLGRDAVAADLVDHLQTRDRRRVLAVGDGPGLTAIKILRRALDQGMRGVEIVVLEPSAGQIANGRNAWDLVLASALGPRLRAADLSIGWVEGSGAEDRFPAGHFDAAFSTYVVGAMGSAEGVADYGRATLRALAPGGRHVALDFFDRRDDPDAVPTSPEQRWARASARLLGPLSDPQLARSYLGIWGHQVGLNLALDRASVEAGATFRRTHRQTRFAHLPLFRMGKWTATFSFAGYNERTAVYVK